jgi:hypothetical protein
LRYLSSLVRSADQDRYITEFNAAISGTSIDPPKPCELPVQAIERLTKMTASKLIRALKD